MKRMEIYEPAMCCPTGICGPGVDPELIRISTTLNNLKRNGIEVKRYNLTNHAAVYAENAMVSEILKTEGMKVLPLVLLDGKVVKTGGYPTNEEFCEWLEVPASHLETGLVNFASCGCEGGKC